MKTELIKPQLDTKLCDDKGNHTYMSITTSMIMQSHS